MPYELGVEINTPSAPVASVSTATGGLSAGAYLYKVTYTTSYGETAPSAASNSISPGAAKSATLVIPVSADSLVSGRKIYRTAANGSTYSLLATISNNTATAYTDIIADASLGAAAPVIDTADTRLNVNGYMSFAKPICETANLSVTAGAGSTYAVGVQLTAKYNKVTNTVTGVVILPPIPTSGTGLVCIVKNLSGANTLKVFAVIGQTVDGADSTTGVTQAVSTTTTYVATSASAWTTF